MMWNQKSNRESCLLRETLESVVLFLDSLLSRKVLQCLKTAGHHWQELLECAGLRVDPLSSPPCWHLISTSGQVPVLCKDKVSGLFLYVL